MGKRITQEEIIESLTAYFGEGEYDRFAQLAEKGQELDLANCISYMIDGFIEYCGVSGGFRTVYYDVGWHLYREYVRAEQPSVKWMDNDAPFCTVMGRFNERYTSDYDKYDIVPLSAANYFNICMEEVKDCRNETVAEALCFGTWLLLDAEFINPNFLD